MKPQNIQDIVELIKARPDKDQFIIFIDGRGGSGKSTVAKKIVSTIDNSHLINLDSFSVENLDLFSDDNIKKGFQIDFENRINDIESIKQEIKSSNAQVIVIEGCFSFKISEIYADLRIWIDINKSIAAGRLNKREIEERIDLDSEIILLSTRKWQEAEDRYIKEFDPVDKADIFFTNK